MDKINEIKEKIAELKDLDKKFEIFGASTHQYKFNSPLSLKEIINFENKYKVKLPKDYKIFLIEIGNGGAGPYHGIFPLKRVIGKFNPENKFELLKNNFPHNRAWNFSEKILDKFNELQDPEDSEIYEFFDEIFWEKYGNDKLTSGSIYIADHGCALRYLLIISGKERGNIWFDQRSDFNGINPVNNSNKGTINFLDWYIEWLNNSINKLKK